VIRVAQVAQSHLSTYHDALRARAHTNVDKGGLRHLRHLGEKNFYVGR
jgi:hypothetical protein